MDNLTYDCIRMKALGYGCHYGKYKAEHPGTAVPRERRGESEYAVCPTCGKKFVPKNRKQVYCGAVCQSRGYYLRRKNNTQQEEE